ncbi:MAG: phosphodiester glycosidase family protein [Cyanobacteria bacterium P01_D01_bin.36]
MKSLFPRKRVSSRRLASSAAESLSSNDVPRFGRRSSKFGWRKVVSLSVFTALGWAAVSSLGVPSSSLRSPGSSVPMAPISGGESPGTVAALIASVTESSSTEADKGKQAADSLSFQLPPLQAVAQANNANYPTGTQISINGQSLPGRWQQKDGRIGISIASMANVVGAELLSTTDPVQQPIRWFPATEGGFMTLPAWWDATDRYIDIGQLSVSAGWTGQPNGNTLQLNVPQSQTTGIRQGKQTWGDRIVVDLSGPATWQLESTDTYTVTIGGAISTEMVRAFRASSGNLITQLHVAPLSGKTVLKIKTKNGATPQIWTAGNPSRVVIDIRRDSMVERDVAWAPGLRWRQQYITVGQHRFPVYMFIARPNPSTLALRPIHANPSTATGIEPIVTTARRQRVAGAVNAGFFNRNNQLPLGAVRNAGQWISGPILGRGAMAWNDSGDLVMDRFALTESVTVGVGESHPILAVNSGYVQAGIGRYTHGWGASYTPIVDNEIVVTVRDNVVSAQQTLSKAGTGSVAIPADGEGYLLAFRSNRTAGSTFTPGTSVLLSSQSQPAVFEQYPNVIGGGPLLIRDRNIVLNPQLEGFSTNFIQGSAPRTAVGKTSDGTWLIATMHDRVGGRGPTLSETAQIMQQLGAVDALNLDGGSSSSLYLGGQLLNRQPRTAARVNNGIGLFVLGQ